MRPLRSFEANTEFYLFTHHSSEFHQRSLLIAEINADAFTLSYYPY
jgi:hypothetical protein